MVFRHTHSKSNTNDAKSNMNGANGLALQLLCSTQ